tara:strand:+ start:2174 stop:2983 length:810 start_codon:yes stop_codon:yes gene_type:complete
MHVMIEITIALLFLGIFAGLLSGFFGIGSGIILVPAYIFLFEFLNFPKEIIPFLATGTSMTTMALVIPNAARTHYKNGNVDTDVLRDIFLVGLLFAFLGRYISFFFESTTLQIIIAVSLTLAALQLIFDVSPKQTSKQINKVELILVIAAIASLTSIVGIGGGILMIPYFKFRGLSMHKAIGTSSVMGFSFALSSSIAVFLFVPEAAEELNYLIGAAFYPAILIVGLSSIYFARVGANLSSNTQGDILKKAFAILVILAAFRVFYSTFL